MASLAVTALRHKKHIQRIVRRSSQKGFFEVDLWVTGQRETIFVDDRLPPNLIHEYKGRVRYYWFSYIEKAFAKFHGSYDYLRSGTGYEAMISLTGEPATKLRVESLTLDTFREYTEKYCVTVGAHRHRFGVSSVVGDSVHVFDPNNNPFSRKWGKEFVPTGINGMFTVSWNSLRKACESLPSPALGDIDIGWIGKYKLVKYSQSKSYTVTVNKPIARSDDAICFVSVQRSFRKYTASPVVVHCYKSKSVYGALPFFGHTTCICPHRKYLNANERYTITVEDDRPVPGGPVNQATLFYVKKSMFGGAAVTLTVEELDVDGSLH